MAENKQKEKGRVHKVRNISFGLSCSQKESGQAASRSSPMDQYAKIGTLLCSLSFAPYLFSGL